MKKLITASILIAFIAGCSQQETNAAMVPPANVNVKALKPDALAILQKGLVDKNSYIRAYSTEAAVVTQSRQFMPQITQLMKDSKPGVRFAAVTAAGDLECIACREQLRTVLEDENESVRLAAAYSLAKINEPEHVQIIRNSLKSQDQTARANAALLLGKLGNRDDLPLLHATLHDADSSDKARMQAVESIARLGDESMYRSKLWALLISKFNDDRVIGIRGMGALNSIESRNAIYLAMINDDIPEVRLAAAEQLARLDDKRGEEEVLKYLQQQTDLNEGNMANSMAVMAIGRLNSPQLNAYLPIALKSQSAYLRIIAAQSILLLE